ncbi:MAG TPA: AI-2E family transporter [Bryobacteraceae bacterium]|nr:AI-2E family transporter [Bryobacteraceae bacterium]
MLGYDSRAARAAWSVFLVAFLLATVYWLRSVLLVFVLAILFAYLLSPLVNLVDRFVARGRSRTYSLAGVYVVLVVLLVVGSILIGNKVAEEAANLAAGFPNFVGALKQKLASPDPVWLQPVKLYALEQVDLHAPTFGSDALPVIQRLGWRLVAALSNVAYLVLIPILSFFFLKDGRKLTDQVLALGSGRRREMWEDILSDLNVLLGQFMRALVIISMATLTFYSIFFAIVGLPYPILLASVAAVLEFIPLVGPVTAAAIILLSAALSGAGHIVLVLVFLIAYRFLNDYGLSPHLMSSGTALHPLLVIFGALAGHELAGIPGMFLSVPVLAALRVLYVRARKAQALPAS